MSLLLTTTLIACDVSHSGYSNSSRRNPSISDGGGFDHNIPPDDSSFDVNVAVTGVSLNYDNYSLYVGKKMTLVATVFPNNASNQEVTWSSSDSNVVKVSTNGTVTGVSEGTAVVTVTTSDGGYNASCTFDVTEEVIVPYIPDETDTSIYLITEETLSKGTYDSSNDEYTFSIDKNYEQIYVNVPDETIILELNGVTIENNENSPIYVEDCDSIEISAKKSTTNNIKDMRDAYTEDEDGQGKGAIYVNNGDLKLKGTGTLNVTANYYNGIHGKDDVKIQKETLNVTAINHGIKGNDSITIVSGTINISCGGDGLHTENSDISSKGNQRGNVTISGGTVTINSWGDAVAASYNAIVEQADSATPTVFTAKTNKYSSYNGDAIETSSSSFYLKMNSNTYSNGGYTYAAYINGSWYKASYKGTLSSNQQGGRPPRGGSSTYYIYQIEKPSGATSFTLYRFSGNDVTSFSTSSYNAKSDAKAFNNAYDTVQISVSGSVINFSNWSNYAASSNSNNKATTSAKGLKAENEIYVKGGTIDIKAYDDAIHANNDGALENDSTPLGNVNILGGTITLFASDDAVHADYTLNISGGSLTVSSSYEGLEANLVNISGGEAYVYATDDGVNATSGKASMPNINVTGGLLDVEVPSSGDTDGIDSNGTYTQTGGVVITKGPGSASGGMGGGAFALDTDKGVTISSGTLIVFGGIENTPSSSVTKTICSSSSVSTGSHTVSFSSASYTTTLKSSTNGCVVYSSLGSATLK